jgi:V8-like Glu-specific endopeptidase
MSATLLTALAGTSAYAGDISGPSQITPSTSMPIWGGFTVEQIADGIKPGPSGENGFTTNAKTGTITLDFDQPYDIDGFKLWNDVVLRAEGIKTFRLDFKTADGGKLSSQIFEAAPRMTDVQIFDLPKISGVTSVDLVVLSSLKEPATADGLPTFLERIEVREIAFTGRASNAAQPPDGPDPKIAKMEDYIDGLQEIIKNQEKDIRELQAELTQQTNRADSLMALLQERDATIAASTAENTALKARVEALESAGPSASPWPPLWGGLSLLALGGLLGWGLSRLRRRPSVPKKDPKLLEHSIIFSGSPMLAGPLPLALAHCEEAYNAVGRIGKALQDVPTGDEDEPCGTGILIAPNKVLTNHHVLRSYESIGTDPNIGIEFYWEKDSDRSEFIPFDTAVAPAVLDGFDAAILTLKETSPNRVPISMIDQPAETLSEREVIVIGYPYTYWSQEDEVISATQEEEPIMGVKRYSEAMIFDHTLGRQAPYGVQAPVQPHIHPSRTMRAICHNASTMGGSSGSAVICKESGGLIALHFGFEKEFGEAENTNFAIPGKDIAQIIKDILAPDVTRITDKEPETPQVNS